MIARSTIAGGIFAALAASTAAFAQTPVTSPKIIISNGGGAGSAVEVPLADSGAEATMQFLSNGDLQVNCRLSDGKCPNIGTGTGGPGAALTFTRSPTTPDINSGFNNLTLNWESTGSQVCFATGPASVANWNGQPLLNSGSRALTAQVTTDTTMDFGIRCFTATGGLSEDSTSVLVKAGGSGTGPTGDPFCAEAYPTVPLNPATGQPDQAFNAYGVLNKVEVDWVSVWGSQPGQASTAGQGGRVGIPGPFMTTTNNSYLAIPFVITSASDPVLRAMRIVWAEASGSDGIQTGSIVATISPCPGDFRTRSGFSSPSDPYKGASCGGTGTNNPGGILVTAAEAQMSGCRVPVGKRMYLNITTYGINSSTPPTSNSCGTGGIACGVRARVEEE